MRQLGIADYELWRDRNVYRTLKSREQQNESLQPEATDKSLSCSTGDHLVDVRGKFAQAAPHDLFEIQASSLLSRTQKLFFRDSSRGSYLILITSTHNKRIILILWKVKKKSLLLRKTMLTSSCLRGIRVLTSKAEPCAKLFGGSLYNKTSICPLIDLRLCEHSIYLIYEKNV